VDVAGWDCREVPAEPRLHTFQTADGSFLNRGAMPAGEALSRRLRAMRSQLYGAGQHEQSSASACSQNAVSDADLESDVAVRSVSFLASLVRAQTDVEEGEPCPGEVAVQRAISTRLAELGASVTDM
jgi:hypothetical protein